MIRRDAERSTPRLERPMQVVLKALILVEITRFTYLVHSEVIKSVWNLTL